MTAGCQFDQTNSLKELEPIRLLCELLQHGKPVTLTPTEFRILQVLSERPGQVMSRHQLVNAVQGYDFEGYERTMDAHIKNLRQKIEEDPKKPGFIKTVYGLGYKFTGTRDED